jgi:soluble lytic murein transglycosylase-like protein
MDGFHDWSAVPLPKWRPRWSRVAIGSLAFGLLLASHHLYGWNPERLAQAGLSWEQGLAVERSTAAGEISAVAPSVTELIERTRAQQESWRSVEAYYPSEVAPVARVLLNQNRDEELVRRIALALVREARRSGSEPRLLLALLLVENGRLDPFARSEAGARGLMQVMPVHLGQWPPCAHDLINVEANICYGARIFAHYLEAERGDMERALLRYNGCSRGTNTPDCQRYPYDVFARAGQTITSWPFAAGAAAP